MKKILNIDNPNVYARYVGAAELHPQLSLIHYDEVSPVHTSLNNYGVYGLFIQQNFPNNLFYGIRPMEASDLSIIAVAPGQLGGAEDDGTLFPISGWALLWSPELMHNSDLQARIRDYHFFSYFATDTLRMEPSEWTAITALLELMEKTLKENEDSASLRNILLAYLRLLLEYCNRIHLRQQSDYSKDSADILKRFHALLEQYYLEGRQHLLGLPTVGYCASQMNYSAHYFGDLFRQTTGSTAIGYIHAYVVGQGKNLLMQGLNISETSRQLGFEFPHHFTRLFKRIAGITPSQFLGRQ